MPLPLLLKIKPKKQKKLLKKRNNENLLGQRHYRRCRTTVYNIEVEDYHTYCVDYQCILAHNQNLCRPAMHAVSELIADDGVAGNAFDQGQ